MRFISYEQKRLLERQEITHVIGFDTEYQKEIVELEIKTESETGTAIKEIEKNKILSYQLNCNSLKTGKEEDVIIYPTSQKPRFTLEELLQAGIQKLGDPYKKCKILLIAHFGVAEWAALADRSILKQDVTLVRGCPVTLKPMKMGNGNILIWRDTLLLAPAGEGSLTALGNLTNTPKVEISQYYKEHMSQLLAEDPALFERYSITDTHVTVSYYMQVLEETAQVVKQKVLLPLTIGGISTEAFVESFGGQKEFEEVFRGRECIEEVTPKGKIKQTFVKTPEFLTTEPLAAGSYVGGMNTSYVLGESKKGMTVLDIDFSSAYPSAMASLPLVDLGNYGKKTKNLDDLIKSDISFAHITYKFPTNDTSKCCIPAATEYGLTYPQNGEAVCTGAELALAKRNGAKIRVKQGLILNTTPEKAFADFLKNSVQTRERYKKAGNKFKDKFYKEFNNSLYGKVAQAVRAKTGLDWTGKKQALKESKVSQPIYAAYITSLVRVALFELIDTLTNEYGATVLSATTDGCMTAINGPRKDTLEEYFPGIFDKLVKTGGGCARLNAGRMEMDFPTHSFLEIKKTADSAVTAKTRVNVMYDETPTGKKLVGKAMAGVHEIQPLDLSEHMHTEKIEKQTKKSLSGAKKIVETDKLTEKLEKGNKELFVADLVKVDRKSTVSLDPDFKNRVEGEGVQGQAWTTLEDMRKARKTAARLRKRGIRATPARVLTAMSGVKLAGGLKSTVLRQVLRLCKAQIGGWSFNGKKYAEIAKIHNVTEETIKNATRSALYVQKLPYAAETEQYLEEIAEDFGLELTIEMVEAVCMCKISKKVIAVAVQAAWQMGMLPKKAETVEKLKKIHTIDKMFVQNNARSGTIKTHTRTGEALFTLSQVSKVLDLSKNQQESLSAKVFGA